MAESRKNLIKVDTDFVKFQAARDLYGLFFEEINRSGDGGLYTELLRNRSFEDSISPKECELSEDGAVLKTREGWIDQFNNGEGLKRWKRKYKPTLIPGWYTKAAQIKMNTEDVLNEKREAALDISFSKAGVIYNTGFNGIAVEKGREYLFYVFAKCFQGEEETRLSVFIGEDGHTVSSTGELIISGNEYRKYELKITAEETSHKANLYLKSKQNAKLRLGFVSLMPAATFKNHGLRTDLMEMLEKLNPQFLRFPGGCAVEGISKANAYRFSDTLGPVWERRTKQIPWHYRATNGIGYHEFLQMCEDLGAAAMYVVNCGITCQARNPEFFDEEEVKEWIRQACDAIDYAIADAATNEWGQKRALAGHPAPFNLKYVEIGNENNHEPYYERYEKFYKVLKEKYPGIRFISNTHTEKMDLPTEIVDEHFYNNTTFFVKGTSYFDEADRTAPEIFIGEYAVTCGTDIANLKAALAESAFLLGVENNQDVVKLTSYAPLFSHIDYKSWHPNLIEFDNFRAFGTPGYYALCMLGEHRGKDVYQVQTISEMTTEERSGRPGLLTNALNLKLKNTTVNNQPVKASHVLSGKIEQSGDGMETVSGPASFMADFPGFAHSLRGYTFAVFGDEDYKRIVYEGDIKIDDPEAEASLTIYNYHSPQLAQIDETMDLNSEWAPDSVDFCSWTIKDGRSNVYNSHWFHNIPLAKEKQLEIPYGEYFHFKIETKTDGFDCYMNDELIHQARFEKFPTMMAAASGDEEDIIIKIVNWNARDVDVTVQLNVEVESRYVIKTLGGMDGSAVNSVGHPYRVIPTVLESEGAQKQFDLSLHKNSLNILLLKKKKL